MSHLINKYKKIFVAFSLILFTALLINNSAFLHMHVTEDGRIIVHSHFVNDLNHKVPVHQHHSHFEYLLISLINSSLPMVFAAIFLTFLTFAIFTCIQNQRLTIKRRNFSFVILRAPPVFPS